ncbi:MAG: HPP family protein [Micavibrio sp.]
MNKNPLTLKPETTVEDALAQMKKAGVKAAAVTDTGGTVMGLFSVRNLIESILPISMVSESGLAGVMIEAAPGLNLRLQKVMLQSVAAVMDRSFSSVYPDTAEVQAARMVAQNGEMVIVLDENTGILKGAITDEDLVSGLLSMGQARQKTA